jgi:predicted O-methyltransferase YrrM
VTRAEPRRANASATIPTVTVATYRQALARVHETLQPRMYLEIGVRAGDSLVCALPGTRVVAVDPAPRLLHPVPAGTTLVESTSDAFFADGTASRLLGPDPPDMAFIDGMHLFEYALRDLLNVEAWSHPGTVVVLDDCLPHEEAWAQRERTTGRWTGDVWKVLLYLQEQRPDLRVCLFDVEPAGLAVVQGLDPTRVAPDLDGAVARYQSVGFEAFLSEVLPATRRVSGDWAAMRAILPAEPFQQWPDLDARAAGRWVTDPDQAVRESAPSLTRRAKRAVLRTGPGSHLSQVRRVGRRGSGRS